MNKKSLPKFLLQKMEERAEVMTIRVLPFLRNSKSVIDVGCGNCFIAKRLIQSGKKVTAVDVKYQALEESVPVTVFDGITLPFPDASFDTGLLLTVMHHTPSPEKIFHEVARVSREIIVIETSHRSLWEKICIVLFDSLINQQFRFYWHSYKTDREWKTFFLHNGFVVKKTEEYVDFQVLSYFHPLYYLVRK